MKSQSPSTNAYMQSDVSYTRALITIKDIQNQEAVGKWYKYYFEMKYNVKQRINEITKSHIEVMGHLKFLPEDLGEELVLLLKLQKDLEFSNQCVEKSIEENKLKDAEEKSNENLASQDAIETNNANTAANANDGLSQSTIVKQFGSFNESPAASTVNTAQEVVANADATALLATPTVELGGEDSII